MNPQVRLFGIALVGALVLAACGGGGGTVTPATPGPTCTIPGTVAQLVYPAPGTSVSASTLTQIVVATDVALPASTYNFYLSSPTGFAAFTVNFATQIPASQVPQPSATPTFANPVYESVTLAAQLPSATPSISVFLNNPSSSCTPAGPYGTFSTQ